MYPGRGREESKEVGEWRKRQGRKAWRRVTRERRVRGWIRNESDGTLVGGYSGL